MFFLGCDWPGQIEDIEKAALMIWIHPEADVALKLCNWSFCVTDWMVTAFPGITCCYKGEEEGI